MKRPLVLALAFGAALAGFGCEDKKPSSDAPRPDASADKYAAADPKLEKALHAAASASAAESGPPPTGVFAAGVADQRHGRSAPTKVDVVAEGSDPRVTLGPAGAPAAGSAGPGAAAPKSSDAGGALSPDALSASWYGPAVMKVMQQRARSGIAVDYALTLGPAKKDDGGAEWLVADVKRAAPAKDLGQVPAGLDKDVASLEGTQFRVRITPDGRESELQTRPGKASKTDLDWVTQGGAEALVFSTVALPPKPIGVGGQWIAETRMPLWGLDVIVYRAFRVKSIEGDRVRLSLDVKAYAASNDAQVAGVPKGATLEQFEAVGQGDIELVRGEALARKAEVQQRTVMLFALPGGAAQGPPGQPQGNMVPVQFQSQSDLLRGEDLRAAARQP
jgi:hypothetical protein